MTANIADYVALYRFSTGRRLFTLSQLRARAAERGDETLVQRIDEAIEHDRETVRLEGLWEKARRQTSRARGRAVELDQRIDRLLGAMHTTVSVLLSTLPPESERARRARGFLDRFFPAGAAAIVNSAFEDQLAVLEHMTEALGAMDRAALDELNVAHFARELAELTPQFKTELSQPSEGFRFDKLRAARDRGHRNLLVLVATIIAQHPGSEPAEVGARRALLAPIAEQNARIRAARRRAPRGPDVEVDPQTGEEIDRPGDEPTAPQPVDDPIQPLV